MLCANTYMFWHQGATSDSLITTKDHKSNTNFRC